jgi:hypothetical protein
MRDRIPGVMDAAALAALADLPAGAAWRYAKPAPADPADRLAEWLRRFWHRHPERRQDFTSPATLAAVVPLGLRYPDYETVTRAACERVAAGGEP